MERKWTTLKEYQDILFDFYNGIARITINRPQVRNAFTPLTVSEMSEIQRRNYYKQLNRCDEFNEWYIMHERTVIIDCIHGINEHIYTANSIYPTCPEELTERRLHQDLAIVQCYRLVQELQYAIETLPVDVNVYLRFAEQIQKEIDLIKGWRKSDNKFKKQFEK